MNPGSRWTREDSRYVDDRLDAGRRAAYERGLAEDPARAARTRAFKDAMDLWREDTDRAALGLDPALLAARITSSPETSEEPWQQAAWRYAAAALVLCVGGLAGSAALGTRPAANLDTAAALEALDRDGLSHHGRLTWELEPFMGRHLREKGR